MKKLPSFLMVLMLILGLQPVMAADLDNPQNGDTKITGFDGGPLNDIYITRGDPIQLKAGLCMFRSDRAIWVLQVWRYLEFYVCGANSDVDNGNIVWHGRALTSFTTGIASPKTFKLDEGTYNLIIIYNGGLMPCRSFSRIYVM